jgi:hypothetical protein
LCFGKILGVCIAIPTTAGSKRPSQAGQRQQRAEKPLQLLQGQNSASTAPGCAMIANLEARKISARRNFATTRLQHGSLHRAAAHVNRSISLSRDIQKGREPARSRYRAVREPLPDGTAAAYVALQRASRLWHPDLSVTTIRTTEIVCFWQEIKSMDVVSGSRCTICASTLQLSTPLFVRPVQDST